jgi:hypothetical protein
VIPDYHFRAEHIPRARTTRLLHWLFYLGALLLLIAGIHSLSLYFTEWSMGDDDSHLRHLLLGLLYLLISAVVVYATYNHGGKGGELPPERYAKIVDGQFTYHLDQVSGVQRVDLARVKKVTKPSVREMILTTDDGVDHPIPIYLIDEDDKQLELERILKGLESPAKR